MCYLRILQIQGQNHRLSVLNRSHQLGCSFDLVLKLIALKFGFQMREKHKCGQIKTYMQLFLKMCMERKIRLKLLKPNSPHSINVRWGGIACSKENLRYNVHSLHCWQLLRKRKWNTQQNLLESGSQYVISDLPSVIHNPSTWDQLQQCTMLFPMSIDILEILKSKNSFLAHFLFKNDYFSSRWCKIVQIFEWIFGFT